MDKITKYDACLLAVTAILNSPEFGQMLTWPDRFKLCEIVCEGITGEKTDISEVLKQR